MQINKEYSIKKRITDIKYLRILWLTKRIAELKKKIAGYKSIILIMALFLSGCFPRGVPIEIYSASNAKPKLIRLKNKDSIMINAIKIEAGVSLSEAKLLWDKYKYSNIRGFINYLIKFNPYEKTDAVYKKLVALVKARSKILKKR